MAFNFMSALGGAAKRGSEIMEEDRRSALELINSSLSNWSEMGLDMHKKRIGDQKSLETKMKTLQGLNFTPDQVDVILDQGKIDEVIANATALENSGIAVQPAEVVSFADDYKETGRTYDDVLKRFMGSVNTGMDSSDALMEATGGSARGSFGQDLSGLMKSRADAFGQAFGFDANYMRALATGDITVEDSPVTGKITITDPVAEQSAKQTLAGGKVSQTQKNLFATHAAGSYGVELIINPNTGAVNYEGGTNEDRLASRVLGARALDKYREFLADGVPEGEAQALTYDWIESTAREAVANKPPAGGVVGDGTPAEDAGTLNVDRTGNSLSEIQNAFASDVEGVTNEKTLNRIRAVTLNKLSRYFVEQENMSPSEAAEAAQAELARLMGE